MDELNNCIAKQDWKKLISQNAPSLLANSVSFKRGMSIAYEMLFNEDRDDDIRDYATDLLFELRQKFPQEWVSDWRNDIFLGDACYITMREEDSYEAYKRAYEIANPPPPYLLLQLAGCYTAFEPLIEVDEAESLVKRALEKELTVEGVVLLRGIYARKKNQELFDHWDKILREVEEKNIHAVEVWPDFLMSES